MCRVPREDEGEARQQEEQEQQKQRAFDELRVLEYPFNIYSVSVRRFCTYLLLVICSLTCETFELIA